MPHIEQDQMPDLSLAKREVVGVLNAIQPRIRENVGRNRLWYVFLDNTDARSEFHDQALNSRVEPACDLTIKLRIYLPQQRLFLPELAVLHDLDIVLLNAKGHGSEDLVRFGLQFRLNETSISLTGRQSFLGFGTCDFPQD